MNYDTKIETGKEEDTASLDPVWGDAEEDRRSRRRVWIIVALVVVLLLGVWFLLHGRSGGSEEDAAGQAAVVTVGVPGKTSITGRINATGTLAARRELPIGSVGEGGQVARVLVEPGQWVRQGQVLALIDSSVQTQQQASLAAQIQVSEADARLAQANLERALKLVDRGFVSTADVDRLTATRDAANARVRVAQAQFAEMRARTRRLSIVAPAAGLLLERNVEPGQVVGPGSDVLFRIAQGGEMEMLAKLGEDDLSAISTGVAAQVKPVGSDKSFTGQVWQISPMIDPQTRQGEARIALAYAPELRPGGFASAEIDSGTVVAPLLPESAVLSDSKGHYVFIVGKDNKVQRRNVTTGIITEHGVPIVQGLSGSEKVVLRAGAFLSDGETVKPKVATLPKG